MKPSRENKITRRRAIAWTALGISAPLFIPRSVLGGNGQPGANERSWDWSDRCRGPSHIVAGTTAGRWTASSPCATAIGRERKPSRRTRQGNWPIYEDYRELLDRQDIDAVIVGTGEFQRVLPCIHACQAGKDVYAEKPLTLYIHEGRVLVDAVRKHERVFQVGSQQRSMEMNRVACELVRNGGLGKIREVRAINYPCSEASPADRIRRRNPSRMD